MATFDFDFSELEKMLGNKILEINDDLKKEMLAAGGDILQKALNQAVIDEDHVYNAELCKSATRSRIVTFENGGVAYVRFYGYDEKTGVPHDLKAMMLEYGSQKRGIQAQPFIRNTIADNTAQINRTMYDIFSRKIGGDD